MGRRIVERTKNFDKSLKHIKNKDLKMKIYKQIEKIIHDPSVGKPLKHDLKGERSVYIKPYRLIYSLKKDKIILLRFRHRKEAYNQ